MCAKLQYNLQDKYANAYRNPFFFLNECPNELVAARLDRIPNEDNNSQIVSGWGTFSIQI